MAEVHFSRAKRGCWGVETVVLMSNLKGPLLCVFAQILELNGVTIFFIASSKFHFFIFEVILELANCTTRLTCFAYFGL